MWSDVQGQPTVVRLLQADVSAKRAGPAYLFIGPPGVGKRASAMELAKALNCANPCGGSCGACDACRRIIRGTHPDLHQLSPEGAAANIRIEQVRQVLERMSLRPFMGRAQVAVLAGAECLTEEAGNLILKSLEEAPASSCFILLTAQPSACLPTIVSRCKPVRFNRSLADARDALQAPASPEATAIVALMASPRRDAWLEWKMPAERDALSRALTSAIVCVRDKALASVERGEDPERCIEAGLKMITLWHSLDEHMIGSRLIGTLVREAWRKLSI